MNLFVVIFYHVIIKLYLNLDFKEYFQIILYNFNISLGRWGIAANWVEYSCLKQCMLLRWPLSMRPRHHHSRISKN